MGLSFRWNIQLQTKSEVKLEGRAGGEEEEEEKESDVLSQDEKAKMLL